MRFLSTSKCLAHDTPDIRPPNSDAAQIASLIQRAIDPSSQYEQLGGMDDLDEAIIFDREAHSLHPPGHPDRSTSLNNLAHHLSSRYEQLGGMDDLNEVFTGKHSNFTLLDSLVCP